jgi:predicted phage terminase large subunit-like protein
MSAPSPSTNEILRLASIDLGCYAVAMWPDFEVARHHQIIIEKLEAVERGEITRLMVFMPPRHGESLLTTQLFPAWFLGRHPDRGIITASYAQDLADDFGRRVRNLLDEPLHRATFPHCQLSEYSRSANRFGTTAGGTYFSVGIGAAITGRGAHLMLIDDPIKGAEEARSETVKRSLKEWYSSVARTRLQPGGAIVLIQTRWHEDDLAGWLLSEHGGEGWDVLSLPAIAETDEPFRKAGEALWPSKFPVSELELIRRESGGAVWASLYQQRPAAAEGAIFKRDQWCFYDQVPEMKRIILSLDTAFKTGTENDYSVIAVWGEGPNGYYLLSLWRDRVEFPKLKQTVASIANQWKAYVVLIEDAASGQNLIQELKSSTALPVTPVKVDRDKVSRAAAVTPLLESGRVFLPSGAPWLQNFIDEHSSFDKGSHDDQVDTTTQALNFLRGSGTPGILLLYEEWAKEAEAEKGIALPCPS